METGLGVGGGVEMGFYIVRLVDTHGDHGACTKMEVNVMPCFFIQRDLVQAFAYMNVKSQKS